jgi:hypothetical protein
MLMMLFMPKGLVGVWDWLVGLLPARRGTATPLATPPPAPRVG